MSKIWTKFSGLIVFGLLLVAYVQGTVAALAAPQDPVNMRILIRGEDSALWPAPIEANDALSNAADLRKTLETYGNFSVAGNLGQLISAIKAAHNAGMAVRGLTGLGGPVGLAFLNSAKAGLGVTIKVSGQITHYEFVQTGFNPAGEPVGNGRLHVITNVKRTGVNPSAQFERYFWKVRVENSAFRVVRRGNPANKPFPNTMDFDQETLDRIDCKGTYANDPTCKKFNFKLWAIGEDIVIEKVWRTHSNADINWVLLPNAGINAKFYDRNDDNCIDMMFALAAGQAVPTQTSELQEPPARCLGRCKNPLIVNTGY